MTKADKILLLCSWLSKNFPIGENVHVYLKKSLRDCIAITDYAEEGVSGKKAEILGLANEHVGRKVSRYRPVKQIFVLGKLAIYPLEEVLKHEWVHHRRSLEGLHDDQFWLELGRVYREQQRWYNSDDYNDKDKGLPISSKFELFIDEDLGLKFSPAMFELVPELSKNRWCLSGIASSRGTRTSDEKSPPKI